MCVIIIQAVSILWVAHMTKLICPRCERVYFESEDLIGVRSRYTVSKA